MCAHIKSSIVMAKFKYILVGSLLLTACAHTPVNKPIQPDAEDQTAQTEPSVQTEPQAEAPAAETPMVLPSVKLSSDFLYEYLISEVAAQRGNDTVAVEGSLDLAKKTRDPRLAMRAAKLALQFGQFDSAIEALKIWRDTDPSSILAKRMLSSVLLRSGKLDEAHDEFANLLKTDESHTAQNFIQIYQMLATYPDQAAALKLMRDLAQPYPRVAEAHWAVAQLAQASDNKEIALHEAEQARSLRPEWDMAVSLEALLLQKDHPQQGWICCAAI
jgi:tetratricopeptide (TPR) repeat protein